MNIIRNSILIVSAILLAGCGTFKGEKSPEGGDMLRAYKEFISQQRTFSPLVLEAAPGETLSITGLGRMEIQGPLPTLSALPQGQSTIGAVADGLTRLATVAGASIVGYNLASGAGKTEVVQQPPPVIVQPTFID